MPIHDSTAGFVCYTRKVLETINLDAIKFKGYAFQIEMKFTSWVLKFKIKEVPQPKVTISGAEKGEISRLDLRKADRLIVELPDFDFDGYEFTIVSYSGYKTVAGELRPIVGTGEMFPKELKDYFNTVSKNQVIQFHNIKAKGPGGIITELDPCYIKVK